MCPVCGLAIMTAIATTERWRGNEIFWLFCWMLEECAGDATTLCSLAILCLVVFLSVIRKRERKMNGMIDDAFIAWIEHERRTSRQEPRLSFAINYRSPAVHRS